MGYSGACGRTPRFLRLVRCADLLHERGQGRQSVAGGSAPDRQRYSALSCGVLARFPDGGRSAAAQESLRSRLDSFPREQDEQVARQRPAPQSHRAGGRHRWLTLFSTAGDHLRSGRQLQLRRADPALQLRLGKRSRQLGKPHAHHDPSVQTWRDSTVGWSGGRSGVGAQGYRNDARSFRRLQLLERPGDDLEPDFGDR